MAFRGRITSTLGQNSSKIKSKFNSFELPEKYKGTIIEKWSKYWKQLFIDYKEVFSDFGKQCKEKPIKTIIYSTLLGSTYFFCKTNPDLDDYNEKLLLCSNEMALVHESCHNKVSADYISYINRCNNEGILKRISIGVASFMWIDNYNKSASIYKAVCPHLKPKYTKFHERIIDVGFMNSWWHLEEKLKDFDINNDDNI